MLPFKMNEILQLQFDLVFFKPEYFPWNHSNSNYGKTRLLVLFQFDEIFTEFFLNHDWSFLCLFVWNVSQLWIDEHFFLLHLFLVRSAACKCSARLLQLRNTREFERKKIRLTPRTNSSKSIELLNEKLPVVNRTDLKKVANNEFWALAYLQLDPKCTFGQWITLKICYVTTSVVTP